MKDATCVRKDYLPKDYLPKDPGIVQLKGLQGSYSNLAIQT